MRLLMYLEERLMDEEVLPLPRYGPLPAKVIQDAMQRLLQKHKQSLAGADTQPKFYLEGVPSCFNNFRSLLDN